MAEHISRAQWGARPPRNAYTALVGSVGMAVHHLGSKARPPRTLEEACARARSTQNYHMDTKGWHDVAYGFGVGAGRIFDLRGFGWIDGADTGVGRLMHSVVWFGDSDAYEVPDEDLDAINQVITEHGVKYPDAAWNVRGHGEFNVTDCPGHRLQLDVDSGLFTSTPASTPPASAPHVLEDDDMASIHRLVNIDGRVEFLALNPTTHRVIDSWQGPDGRLSAFQLLLPEQPEDFVALDAERADDGRLTATAFGRSGTIWGTWQPAPGQGPWVAWFKVADLLAFTAARR